MIVAAALPGLPQIGAGDDLAVLLLAAAARDRGDGAGPVGLGGGDVVVIAHKAISKAEGRVVALAGVAAGERALALAAEHGKDPRVVELILRESSAIVRSRPGVLICRTRHGYVCANAGVDASNAPADGTVVLLPIDPDASARALRARLRKLLGDGDGDEAAAPAVVISDSFGRAWRVGQTDVAIGIAGLAAVDDWRGRRDAAGRALEATIVAVADEAAAAADLARRKDSGEPAVVVRGLERHVTDDDGPGAAALVRARADDLFL